MTTSSASLIFLAVVLVLAAGLFAAADAALGTVSRARVEGLQRQGRTGCELSHDTRSQDNDLGRRDTGYTTQQHTLTVVGRAEVLGGDQHYGTTRNLTHAAHNG